jgi:hypothetical protein
LEKLLKSLLSQQVAENVDQYNYLIDVKFSNITDTRRALKVPGILMKTYSKTFANIFFVKSSMYLHRNQISKPSCCCDADN